MGSSYYLHEEHAFDVCLDEMSGKLSLGISNDSKYDKYSDYWPDWMYTNEMEPVQMLRLLMEGIKATSYYISKEDFYKTFKELEVFPYD